MTKEILFKAKRKDNGEWVYGQIVKIKNQYFMSTDYTDCINKTAFVDGTVLYNLDTFFEVIPETVCQYTGLDDKNGNKIFENDVVKNHSNYKAIVKFGEYEYGYGPIKHCGFYIRDIEFNDVFNLWGSSCEVIGNKFDEVDNK